MDDASALRVSPDAFDRSIAQLCGAMAASKRETIGTDEFTPLDESRDLIRLFVKLRDPHLRQSILMALRSIVTMTAQD